VGVERGLRHLHHNAGKRSVVADLGDPAGVARVRALARWADLLVETAAPGALAAVGLGPDDLRADMRADVTRGLQASPKELPSKYFYDEEGSALFDAITRLPEYYLTRRESEILRARAAEIAALTGADTVIELGSGRSGKTRLLLDSFSERGLLRRFAPFDVSETVLRASAAALVGRYPGIEVHAVVGDIERHLAHLPRGDRRLVAFLGSTIGNFPPARRRACLREIAAGLEPGDAFLLGTDLAKDVDRLEAAYNDTAGVTAAFNRNILWVLNRELEAEFAPERFDHVARWNAAEAWIEMLLRAQTEQRVRVGALALTVEFADGEEMRTEISAKFTREGVEAELAAAGLELTRWWTDPAGDFALALAVPAS
jgi:L-histidine N-alpha-methyltransferase